MTINFKTPVHAEHNLRIKNEKREREIRDPCVCASCSHLHIYNRSNLYSVNLVMSVLLNKTHPMVRASKWLSFLCFVWNFFFFFTQQEYVKVFFSLSR